jgi:hypothetical protein
MESPLGTVENNIERLRDVVVQLNDCLDSGERNTNMFSNP